MDDHIGFAPLQHAHFALLLKWLETGHVKAWWDQDIHWTPLRIEEKYDPYAHGYKIANGVKKPIHAFIICFNSIPVGYIQYYNAYDFPRDDGVILEGFPEGLAALDLYIGEADYISKGLGPLLIDRFLKRHVWKHYAACFVDVEAANAQARRAYEKAGFKFVKTARDGKAILYAKDCKNSG